MSIGMYIGIGILVALFLLWIYNGGGQDTTDGNIM